MLQLAILAALSVMYDGALVPASAPPVIVDRTAMVPLRPYIVRLAGRISFDPRAGTLAIERGSTRVHLRLGSLHGSIDDMAIALPAAPFVRGDAVYVPLAAVARALGDRVAYAARLHAVEVLTAQPRPLSLMTPFDPLGPSAAPTVIFTPQPIVTERPLVRESPRPRRTPLAVRPSRP